MAAPLMAAPADVGFRVVPHHLTLPRCAPLEATAYAAVYTSSVRRTNIYLSEVQQSALDALAAAEGRTRSDVLRAAIDRELNLDEDAALDAALADMASELAEESRRLAAADPDLRIE